MNKKTMYIIAIILVVIFIVKLLTMRKSKLEHLTPTSDEAIQNLASLYNKDKLTIGSMNITGTATAESVVSGPISTTKIQFGKQFDILPGIDDNDTYIRIYKRGVTPNTNWNAADYNSIALADVHSFSAGQSMTSLDKRISALEGSCVRKGPVTISASYGNAFGNARNNIPLRISDNYYLRAWYNPNEDNAANSLGSQLTISQ